MDDYNDKDFLEMPFGPPPILPDIKTELKEYLIQPEKLPIHQLDRVQQFWERDRNILSLLRAELAPATSMLKYERDPISGSLGKLEEVSIKNVGKTVRNSMSMSRAPGPAIENVRGNTSNFLFWPGGFDEPQKTVEEEIMKIDFENNLRTTAKGFSSGIEFMSDNCTPKYLKDVDDSSSETVQNVDENINLKKLINIEKKLLNFSCQSVNEVNEGKAGIKKCEEIDLPNIDEFIEPFKQRHIPVLNISENPKTCIKAEWAEQVDVMTPVTDFYTKIPEPAIIFPYELDTFQKQAILKLEEQQDVFIAAHTSAGKTTIAEYAIAMSRKHMTRTIYTSPIKALSNQKFREFKEKFENVGLITGDIQINPTAMCLIMTTEILQSMLYCGAEIIRDVEFVVFDEVHYINNQERGHVWEEVIILLPPAINIVMLSATVPNPITFANWVGQIKKRKMYVISTVKRPVPLEHYLYTGHDKKTKNQIFQFIDKNGIFDKDSVKEASYTNPVIYCKPIQKPSPKLVLKTAVAIKNTSTIEAVEKLTEAKEQEEKFEDKQKEYMLTLKEKRMWLALLEHLESTNKLPVVIFTLSRNRCDRSADAFSVSMLKHEERQYVQQFFKKSIRHLKGTDSQLPQVIRMQRLLTLGIGVHHSGILPILKEIVEMLFQQGIVKILFATETFAMGVNMPAKTVVFDSIRKFDGDSFRNLLPTEYIQMAGRAGRRGHDDTGTVIILCKKKVPNEKELRDMAQGQPQELVSQFKVTYALVLRLQRLSESITVSDMMRRSFKEAKMLKNMDKNKIELFNLEKIIRENPPLSPQQKKFECFYDSAVEYINTWKNLRPSLLDSNKAAKALVEGRVLLISYKHHYHKIGIFLGIQTKMKNTVYKVFVLTTAKEKETAENSEKSEIWYDIIALTKIDFYVPDENPFYEILFVPASAIMEITNSIIHVNTKLILSDWEKRQIPRFKDAPLGPSTQTALDELHKLSVELQKNSNVILPFVECKISNFNLQEQCLIMQNHYKYLQSLKNAVINEPNFENELCEVFKFKQLQAKYMDLCAKLSDESLENFKEFDSRINILKTLNYIDQENRVTFKGRVALEMGTYEIFLTELVLDNIITTWKPEEIAAMLSSLVFQNRKNEEENTDTMIPRLIELKKEMMAVYNRLKDIEVENKLTPIPEPNFYLMQVVYEWASAKSFAKIMELTDIQEGIIVRCIQQLNETLQDVRNAAIIIGNTALREKMEEASTLIKRDIVFTASLYTQD